MLTSILLAALMGGWALAVALIPFLIIVFFLLAVKALLTL